MHLNEEVMKMTIYFRGGQKSEILIDKDEAETIRAGIVHRIGDLRREVTTIRGYLATPLLVRKTLDVVSQDISGVDLVENPQIEYTVPFSED